MRYGQASAKKSSITERPEQFFNHPVLTTAMNRIKQGSRRITRPMTLREWAGISLLMMLLTAGLAWLNGLGRLDQALYDRFLQANSRAPRTDIVIVAIDDYSLVELGKWPWPHLRHTELIRQISAAKPAAIGLDILFPETDNPHADSLESDDGKLAAALTASNKVILPLGSGQTGREFHPATPPAILSAAARQLGHLDLELDKDGVARSVFLQEGMRGEWWPHFALAVRDVGRDNSLSGVPDTATKAGMWRRDFQMPIPYYGSSGRFTTVPYVAVLRGEVPANIFRGKYVLVGATAAGMADSLTMPTPGNEAGISGVEINANILASLLDGKSISMASSLQTMLFCLLPVALVWLSYLLFTPRIALSVTGGLIAATIAFSYAAMLAGTWLPPAAALLVLAIAYPVWRWRRLEAAIRSLGEEFILLDKGPNLLPELSAEQKRPTGHPLQEGLEQRIDAMRNAARRLRDLRQFVSDGLNSLPDATLVTSVDGNVILSNPPAMSYFASIGYPKLQDAMLPYLFTGMRTPAAIEATPDASFSWWNLLDMEYAATMAEGIEIVDPQGRDLRIRSSPCFSDKQELTGWIVSVLDISQMRAAERSRDATLHFISHAMRAPQASILAMLELQQDPQTAVPAAEFLARMEKVSRTALALADNFVELARAESPDYRLEDMDFRDVLLDAADEMWSLAKDKKIRLLTQIPEDDYPVRIDRGLMTRALSNLLSNAIKYSPPDTTVTCSLIYVSDIADAHVLCVISDQGYGIARADQNRLFKRFQHFKLNEQAKNDGVGLGMAFVKTVIDRHHGKIEFVSAPQEGTTFQLKLPAFRH